MEGAAESPTRSHTPGSIARMSGVSRTSANQERGRDDVTEAVEAVRNDEPGKPRHSCRAREAARQGLRRFALSGSRGQGDHSAPQSRRRRRLQATARAKPRRARPFPSR